MVLIYSDTEIKSLGGVYVSPSRFRGVESGVDVVYTSDATIKQAYNAIKVEVKGFPRTTAITAKEVLDD